MSIAAHPPAVKRTPDEPARGSSQEYRKLAAAFTKQLAAGAMPMTPPARVTADTREGAVVVTETGERHPVSGWWFRSRLAAWCDRMVHDRDYYFGNCPDKSGRVVSRLVLRRITFWVISDAWLIESATRGAAGEVDRG